MKSDAQYNLYTKPKWAPPSWLFAPVWSVLYLLIAISYGYVGYQYMHNDIPFVVVLPFILNFLSNAAFTFIQFTLKNFVLGLVDILIVLATLVWALVIIYPIYPWVALVNLPYLAWVAFATVLEITIALKNKSTL